MLRPFNFLHQVNFQMANKPEIFISCNQICTLCTFVRYTVCVVWGQNKITVNRIVNLNHFKIKIDQCSY